MRLRLGRIDPSLAFGLFLVLLIGGGVLVAYLVSRPPDPYADAANDLPAAIAAYRAAGLPWEAADFSSKVPPEADNAATYIYQAINLEGPQPRFRQNSKLQKLENAEKYSAMLPLFASEEKVLDLARRAANCKHLVFQRDWDLGFGMKASESSDVRSMSRLLRLHAVAIASSGDVQSAIADMNSSFRLALLLQQDPLPLSQITAETIAETTISAYGFICNEFRNDSSALTQLVGALDQASFVPDPRHGLGSEAYQGIFLSRNAQLYGGLKSIDRRLRQDEGYQFDLWLSDVKIDPTKLVRTGIPEAEADRANLDLYLRTWLSINEILKPGLHPPTVAAQMAGNMIDSAKTPPTPLNILQRAALRSESEVLYNLDNRLEVWKVLTKVLLRAAEMKARTGRYPTSLSEIPGMWMDPYNQKPVRVRATKNAFRVYSVGPDLKDDGGYSYRELTAKKKQGIGDMIQSIPLIR